MDSFLYTTHSCMAHELQLYFAMPAKKKKSPGIEKRYPTVIEPMLATKIKEPFDDDNWLYEIKWDGYRIIAHIHKKKVKLHSRRLQDYTKLYPPISGALLSIRNDCILDGEVVVLDKDGKPNFDELQKYRLGDHIIYYVFDILWLDGYDITGKPLEERKELLKSVLPLNDEIIQMSESFENGTALFEKIRDIGMEGIVAKKKESVYKPATRTTDWLKIPAVQRSEYVIGGWTESESGRPFRSLLFGHFDKGKLVFVGHSGSGYKDRDMKEILNRLRKIEIKKNPFATVVDHSTKPHWVRPELVAEFQYATFTRSGKIRKPAVFLGFRHDKKAKQVTKEKVVDDSKLKGKKERVVSKQSLSADSNWRILDKQKITSKEDFQLEDCKIQLTNVEMELWKGITKADLIQYYHAIAPYILKQLADRPLSLHIKHNGPHKEGIYIKDMEGRQPDCASVFETTRKHKVKGKNDIIQYLVCNNEGTLLWMINLGCIDVNPWTSRIISPLEPDHIIIDLDPSDDDFSKAISAAQAAKEIFDKYHLKTFVKTSGKTGIHVFIPCEGYSFPEARMIAESLCELVRRVVPSITTTTISKAARGNKLYLDPNQNDESDTVASAYSVRPFHLPTVSAPLHWREINEKLDAHDFTIHTMMKRVQQHGDLWEKIMDQKIRAGNSKKLRQL